MKKVLSVLLFLIIGAIFYSFGLSTYENIMVDKKIEAFKNAAIYDEELSTEERKFYYVKSNNPNENPAFNIEDDRVTPGFVGDILVTRDSPYPKLPVIHQFISYYFGGHAAIVIPDNYLVEMTGYLEAEEKLTDYIFHKVIYDEDGFSNNDHLIGGTPSIIQNYFGQPNFREGDDYETKLWRGYYRDKFIGLRVNTTDEVRQQAANNAIDLFVNKVPYNFLFFLDTQEKYYCTDFIARVYEKILDENGKKVVNLNNDGFIYSVNDIILSRDVYLYYYFELDKNGVEHIYYLKYVE